MGKKIFILVLLLLVFLGYHAPAQDVDQVLQQRVSPTFMGARLGDALRMFAQQYRFNYVFTGDGAVPIYVRLTNVPLGDALEYMLKPNGYHYLVKDNIIIIKPLNKDYYGELDTRIFRLQYVDALKVKEAVTPFLSTKGKLEVLLSEKVEEKDSDRASTLIVSDLQENLTQIERIIRELDRPVKQLQIEVRLIETLLGTQKNLGISWPTSVKASMMGAEVTAPITKSAQSGTQEQTVLSGWYQLPETSNELKLGVLTVDKLEATLNLLAQDNNSRLVSNPRVVTLNNHKAIIRIGTTVPIPEISRSISGDLYSYKEREVSMSLEVIPVIGDDNKITLRLHPSLEEIIGYTGQAEAPQPIISVREVETAVVINDGETVAIGGLVKETRSEQQEKIWLLGNIPILGYLFKNTVINKEKNDLLIFITSKIIEQGSE